MRIIPAIDIIDGKCVRLTQGDYARKTTYNENPLEVAKMFEAQGVQYLHLVDLDGAKASHVVNYKVLSEICTHTNLKVDFSGGIKTHDDLRKVLDYGANQVSIGSVAVKNPELFLQWLQEFGKEKIILSADVKNNCIAVHGWQEESAVLLFDFLKTYYEAGIQYVICTDISKDGMLQGASVELYQNIQSQFPELHIIASGGVSDEQDIQKLHAVGCEGVIIGKAIYEGRINLKNVLHYA
jgi:phosphoribosylformimino-5-aminoimidazole carboxamide ribotide isomerase